MKANKDTLDAIQNGIKMLIDTDNSVKVAFEDLHTFLYDLRALDMDATLEFIASVAITRPIFYVTSRSQDTPPKNPLDVEIEKFLDVLMVAGMDSTFMMRGLK